MLTASTSRRGGGLFEAVRGLSLALQSEESVAIRVFSLRDAATDADAPLWNGIGYEAYNVMGPSAFGFSPSLRRALRSAEIDIAHIHGLWTYVSCSGEGWARSAQRSYVMSPHGMLDRWAFRHHFWKKQIAATLHEDRHLQGAACIHAVCDAEVLAIREHGLRNPICVVAQGVELPGGTKPTRSPEAGKTLLYLGRLSPQKGLENLLQAWRSLRGLEREAGWRLMICGWDQFGHGDKLRSLSEALGIAGSVDFAGPRFDSAKESCLASVDAFVLPSLSEGSPIAVLEAWANRLPVLMTPQCNLPEGFSSEAAIRIEADPDSIAAGLRSLFALSSERLSGMGSRGRSLVERRFQWKRAASEMRAVYEWLLGGGAPPPFVATD